MADINGTFHNEQNEVSLMGGCQSKTEHDCVIGSRSDMDSDESENEETHCVENEDMKKRMKESLFKAIEQSDCGRLRQLLLEAHDLGLDINCQNTDRPSCDYARGNSLLHDAASKGHYELCEILLKSGASVNLQNTDGFTALHKAKSLRICKLLSKYGADFDAATKRRETVLHYAADAQIANYYISRGLKVTEKQAVSI
ncbi:putative ankyrin repeat protein RF_0381 [Anneissia japonica]|uniref:putative ankyrin repeat protein RF_0381 n=1 Tax=Anneissia japonica TaxID=1529436 RepID=UPI0014254F18|nr:putative ankyrin repeat protein RF_0381 [Anneissia japonica]